MKDERITTLTHTPQDVCWCAICLQDLAKDKVWFSDDRRDGRFYCYDCAPDDAVRAKDLT